MVALDEANAGRVMSGTLGKTGVLQPTKSVCIWRMNASTDFWVDGEFELLHGLSAVNFWQKAQRGSFTRLTHKRHLDIVDYLTERGMAGAIHRFVIPGREAWNALPDLEKMNISFATLFPDLRGAALHANVAPALRFLSMR